MKYSLIMDKVPVAALSRGLATDAVQEIARAEQEYRDKIHTVCDDAIAREIYILLITGPSSSGKTTTARLIADELSARGKKVSRISLDNFYKNVDELPLWSDGYQNYESIEGLDTDYFAHTIRNLLEQGHADLPFFDFTTGRRAIEASPMDCDPQTFLIIEGIHALNPLIFQSVEGFPCMKLYISVHSDFVDAQGQILMSARDLRLTRRMIRDFYYRDTAAEETFRMWDYVLRGENLYIRPFRRYADLHINSTHNFEPFLYHEEMVRMLCACDANSSFAQLIEHLLDASEHFFPLPASLIPDTSLIQEFLKPKEWK